MKRPISEQDLQELLEARTTIGIAMGILMERFDLDRDRAFAVLKRISSHSNRRLALVAADLVETGQLPDGAHVPAHGQAAE